MAITTIRDVAEYTSVGVGTFSRVLNNHPFVSDATRQKVLDAIAELDYTPNSIARCLSLRKTLTIAVIVPFFTRPAHVEQLRGVEYVLADSEYDLALFYQFFIGLPKDLAEAALVDGASHFRIYWNVILPLSKPVFSYRCHFAAFDPLG